MTLCGAKLADPGQKWNATDAIIDTTLPRKRLIWAAVGGDYYVVHYERGGIAHTFHLLVAKLTKTDSEPKLVWRAIGCPFKNYAAFVDALRSGNLDDRMNYAQSAALTRFTHTSRCHGGSTSLKAMRKNPEAQFSSYATATGINNGTRPRRSPTR